MCNSRDYNCNFCGSENTREVKDGELCDTYGGDYSYQYVRRCSDCGKYFYSYQTNVEGRSSNWDRSIDPDSLVMIEKEIRHEETRKIIKQILDKYQITMERMQESNFMSDLSFALEDLNDEKEVYVATIGDKKEIIGAFLNLGQAEKSINKAYETRKDFGYEHEILTFKPEKKEEN